MSPKLRNKSRAERTEEMRQSILDASLELFIEQGYEKTTTRQIIQRVGILNGSLYNIYKSKDDIFADIGMNALSETLEAMDGCIGRDSSFEDKFCFLPCIQVYASFRSPRIAELLAFLNEKYGVNNKITVYRHWLSGMGDAGKEIADKPDYELRMAICTGALGSILRIISKNEYGMEEKEVMKTLCSLYLGVFGLSTDGVKGFVDRLIPMLSMRDVRICGIRV